MPHLVILQGPDTDRRIDLQLGEVVIGRSPRCDVVLNDREVSRRHVSILTTEESVQLEDLGSSNGTQVNGRSVGTCILQDRDRVQIGRNLLLFSFDEIVRPTSEGSSSQSIDDDSFAVHIVPEDSEGEAVEESLSQIRYVYGSSESADSSWRKAPADEVKAERSVDVTTAVPVHSDQYWQMMYRAVMQISHTGDLPDLVDRILEMIVQWIQCDRACILLSDPVTNRLMPVGRKDRKRNADISSLEISQTILDYVLEKREGVLTSDALQDSRWDTSASISRAGVREAICVPMPGRHGMVGVIYIDTASSAGRMTLDSSGELLNSEHLKLLSAIAHHAALVVEDVYNYRAMLQSERLATMGTVIATISHHIKNILQGIEGGSYLVNDALKRTDLDAVKNGWKVVEKNQTRIKALVLDMLAYSKERRPMLCEQDMNFIVAEVVELVEANAQDQGVELRFLPAPTPAYIYGESEALYHAILNLITNAIDSCVSRRKADRDEKYLPQVTVKIQATQSLVETAVIDNGQGLREDQIDRLFVAFESTKGAGGSGLGLAVSKKIVNEHGGHISVESELNKGTCFNVQLPIDSDRESNRSTSDNTLTL